MRVIAINHIDAPHRLAALPPSWEPRIVETPIIKTYRQLSKEAVVEGWGTDVVVIQDDVRIKGPLKLYPSEELVVYGQTTGPQHICPRAFAASQLGWSALYRAWMFFSAGNSACRGFGMTAQQIGLILDVTDTVPDANA